MLAHGDLAEARLPRNVKVPQVQSRRGVWPMTFMKRVAPVVDETIQALGKVHL